MGICLLYYIHYKPLPKLQTLVSVEQFGKDNLHITLTVILRVQMVTTLPFIVFLVLDMQVIFTKYWWAELMGFSNVYMKYSLDCVWHWHIIKEKKAQKQTHSIPLCEFLYSYEQMESKETDAILVILKMAVPGVLGNVR